MPFKKLSSTKQQIYSALEYCIGRRDLTDKIAAKCLKGGFDCGDSDRYMAVVHSVIIADIRSQVKRRK